MATQHLVKLAVTLIPTKTDRALSINIGIDQNRTEIKLTDTTTINFEFVGTQTCNLNIELIEKQDQEAVIIEQISFFGITDPRFAWAGVYKPQYPEPWATEQQAQGHVLEPQLCPHTYLGWPGQWTLTFDVPVFTWIHKIQNLGWIYS
jgi:hypothetical protein